MLKKTATKLAKPAKKKLEPGDLVEIKQIGKLDGFLPQAEKLIGVRGKIYYLGTHWGGGWRAIALNSLSGSPFHSVHFYCARVALIEKGGK